MSNPRYSKEVEAVLIIKQDFDLILDKLTALRAVHDYRLEPGPSKKIRDTYFDNPRGDLRRRRTNFRIREIDDQPFISVKSNARRTLRGAVSRKEEEVPWSRDSLDSILRELRIERDRSAESDTFSDKTPIESLKSMGFRIMQDRETKRTLRTVSRQTPPAEILAELAIDQVTYHTGDRDVEIFEVEIEQKARRSGSTVADLAKSLVEGYGPALQRWGHGKFVTGMAIQRMLESGALMGLLERNRLWPEAFSQLDREIRSVEKFRGLTLLRMLKPSW